MLQVRSTHARWQMHVVSRAVYCTQPVKHTRTRQLALFTPFLPLTVTFLLTQTINLARAGFYPPSRGHNYIKYTIASCDFSFLFSVLMNVSPCSPVAAQINAFWNLKASLMPSSSCSDDLAFHGKHCMAALQYFSPESNSPSAIGLKSGLWCKVIPVHMRESIAAHILWLENEYFAWKMYI